jgi:hypothetical protein
MSEHQVIFSDVNLHDLQDLLEAEGIPLDRLPTSAEHKQALLDQVAGNASTVRCREVAPGAVVCTVVRPHHEA